MNSSIRILTLVLILVAMLPACSNAPKLAPEIATSPTRTENQGPDREPGLSPAAPLVVSISRARALEIGLAELAKDWGVEGIQAPRDPVVRLSVYTREQLGSGGPINPPVSRLVWVVQVESEAGRSGAVRLGDPEYIFQGVFLDPESGRVVARYGSESNPNLYPASLRTSYSSECSLADPVDGMPPIDLTGAVAIAKNAIQGMPAGPDGGEPDFSIADADLIACPAAGPNGQQPMLYWLVTVPARMSLARCGPVVVGDAKVGATCWSGHTFVRVDGANGFVSVGPQVAKRGPLLSALELEQLALVVAGEGWWKVWSVLRDYGGSRPPPAFTYALAAHEFQYWLQPASHPTFPLDTVSHSTTYPNLSPYDDSANWAAQRSVSVIVVGRVGERTGTFAIDMGDRGVESYGLWQVEIEEIIAGRLHNNQSNAVTVRFSDPGPLVRFPTLTPGTGARVVLFLEPAISMGDPARALDLEPAAMPGINGVVRIEGDFLRLSRGDTTVEEPLSTFLETVRAIRAGLAGEAR